MAISEDARYAAGLMMQSGAEGVLLVAHGTVTEPDDLLPFLTAIRRGRPPSDELLREMRGRYDAIGGSPLLATTLRQASLLESRIERPVLVGMRFGNPSIEQTLREAAVRGLQRLVILPMAPYSVNLYAAEVRLRYSSMQGQLEVAPLQLSAVVPWGNHPGLVRAHVESIRSVACGALGRGASVVLSAHSLPMHVIEAGDSYAEEVATSARAIAQALGVEVRLGFQSQGADGGRWLGPDLTDVVRELADCGKNLIVVAPFGFLSDHVETLYDLDIALRKDADTLGVELCRIPALGLHPQLIDTLADLVGSALNVPAEASPC